LSVAACRTERVTDRLGGECNTDETVMSAEGMRCEHGLFETSGSIAAASAAENFNVQEHEDEHEGIPNSSRLTVPTTSTGS
jgi:hypothetical protein